MGIISGRKHIFKHLLVMSCMFVVLVGFYVLYSYSKETKENFGNCQFASSAERFKNGIYLENRHIDINFKPSMTPEETSIDLLRVFASSMQIANIQFMLFYGSLLGVHRHHSRIPWDEDIDVLINISYENAVSQILAPLPGYSLRKLRNKPWKFCMNNKTKIPNYKHTFPYIDIFFFTENNTHITQRTVDKYKTAYSKTDIFPLQNRPYHGELYPVPCNVENVLIKDFGLLDICVAPSYNYRSEYFKPQKPATVLCETLHDMYPFVFRERHKGYIMETVKIGKCVLERVKTTLPCNV